MTVLMKQIHFILCRELHVTPRGKLSSLQISLQFLLSLQDCLVIAQVLIQDVNLQSRAIYSSILHVGREAERLCQYLRPRVSCMLLNY